MSDLQTKIGGGLSKLQDGLQHGKNKLQTAQEVSQLKKNASDAATNRSKIISQLGELTYRLIRKGEIQQPELNEQAERLLQYDLELYQANRALESQLQKEPGGDVCECGAAVNEEDTFCGSCGNRVQLTEAPIPVPTVQCTTCKEEIPETASFCGCCGSKNG
ncbi:zinc ribbon domain-containing protein [Guptibacillus hwajinpoensis]|uniref:zinc ribbon domain-containing protein n=1 Tax=Guptibacillus hwajinpoensis TaxID=208199 RepID=UPI001CFC55EC|nr:zinc ribbon domain-containing protein [Pseudalkalibacillus hwajinpoensis]WLR61368.1 zinc ribbon domain-containing protein [Pseudalkalibacillus hwajinpoensis]